MITSPAIVIREGLAEALSVTGIKVHQYRFTPFDPNELPAINILPSPGDSISQFRVNFRSTRNFKIDVALIQNNDCEDFAATLDNTHEAVLRSLLKCRLKCLNCSKLQVTSQNYARDSTGQLPIVVISFGVSVSYDDHEED